MRDFKACRACLDTTGILVKINNTYRRIFESACGVLVSPDDGYPYYFCIECMAHIKKILAFRRKSRRADFVLKEIRAVRKEVSFTDVATVDRKVTNLVSSLEIWKPQNIHFFDRIDAEGDNQFLNEDVKYVNGTIQIECSKFDKVDEETKDFDEGVDDMAVGEDEFDTVDDIVTKLGVDDTSNGNETTVKEGIVLNDLFKGKGKELVDYEEMKKLGQAKAIPIKKRRLKINLEEHKNLIAEVEMNGVNNTSCRSLASKLANFTIKLFSLKEQISWHEKRWTLEPFKSSLFKCTICVKVFANVQLLIEHCEDHNQTLGKFPCNVCKLRFEDEEDAAVHMSESHRYGYTCKLCTRHMYDFNTAMQHECPSRSSHKESIDNELHDLFHMVPQSPEEMRASLEKSTGSLRCTVCRLAFTNHTQYVGHLNKHTQRSFVKTQCDICGIYHVGDNALSKHMSDWHQYSWQCKKCDFETSQRYRAIEHMEDHKASSDGCPYCRKTSITSAGLRLHIHKMHYKDKFNRICPLCGAAFSSDIIFYSHQLQKHEYIYLPHPPQEPNELTCVHCNIEFKSKRAFETHALSYGHEEAKDIPFTCRPCKKIFDNEESRNMHALRCKLVNVFPMPCSVCNVQVTSGMDYYHHCRRSHPSCRVRRDGTLCDKCGIHLSSKKWSAHICRDKNKLFECTMCDQQFMTGRSYGLHMIYKHTNRPFHCALCPDKFKRRMLAKEHILKYHTPVEPHTCSICGRQFALLKHMKEHTSTIHGVGVEGAETPKIASRKLSIFIYPHMKLDVSQIDKNKLKQVKFQVRDYNDTVIETINNDDDYNKYLIFDPIQDKTLKDIRKRIKRIIPVKHKKKKVENVVESGENLEIIEIDGNKYVTINDVVYQVENQ